MRLSLITLGDPGRLSGGYLYHRRMAEAAPDHGVDMTFESVPDRPLALSMVSARHSLASAAEGADVVALDSIAAAHIAPWVRRPSVPLVAVLHQPPGGIDRTAAWMSVLRRLDVAAYRRATLVVAASESIAAAVVSAGIAAARVRLVPPGRDGPTDLVPAPPEGLRRGRQAALLCVANWQARKGIAELLAAVKLLPPGLATVHLVGDPDVEPKYRERVRRELEDPDLAGAVVVHGRLTRSDVDRMYAGADVFVLPSFREPYGTVYGEAMSHGLPVIGWAAGNLPNLISDGHEGAAVPTGDVAALARALRELIEDPERRAAMAEAARRRAARLPTWADSAAAFFAAMREAAGHAEP